ncbi:MAG TPA: hypothetical protein DCZ72_10640 [Armatimonadetes bacterium]|nr:hypothetical protein [Armatimonadota bacterium]
MRVTTQTYRRWRWLGLAVVALCGLSATAAPRTTQLGPAGQARRAAQAEGGGAQLAPAVPVIAAIDVQPARYESLVREAMRSKVGEPYDEAVLQEDVNTLFELGWFKFAGPDEVGGSQVVKQANAAGEMVISVNLVENPIVAGITFHGVEAEQQPTAEQLNTEVGYLRVGWPLNTNRERVDRGIVALTNLYRDVLGIPATVSLLPADVAPGPFEALPDNQVQIHVLVDTTAAPEPAAPAEGEPAEGEPAPATPTEGEQAPTEPDDTTAPAEGEPAEGAPIEGAPPADGTEPAVSVPPAGTGPALPDLRMRITAIEIRGLKTIAEGLVRETITAREGQLFDRVKVQEDIDRLNSLGFFYFASERDLLNEIGYPLPPLSERGSRVEPTPDPDGQGLTLVFQLVEHPTVRDVELVGNTLFTTEELLAQLNHIVVGRAFRAQADTIERDIARISDVYAAKGYQVGIDYGAGGRPLLSPYEDGVRVSLTIHELRVGTITFNYLGKRKTNPRVFLGAMKTKTGDFYNLPKIGEDLREIMRLDVVDRIELSRETTFDPEDPTRLNLTFDVTEKRTLNLNAGGGVSSRYGLVGFGEVAENNLWGLGHRASLRLDAGGRFSAETSYFYPFNDGHGSELNLRLYNTDDRTGASGLGAFTNRRQNFNQTRRGGLFMFSRRLGPGLRGSVGYKLENVSTARRGSLLPTMPPFPFQDVGSDTTSSITLMMSRDVRDFPMDATNGSLLSGSLEWAGLGGDSNFQKYRLEARKYMPLFKQTVSSGRQLPRPAWVLAGRAQIGLSTGRLPFSQSYFIGGAESLRGYTEDRFFGNRSVLFNLELRRALPNNIQAVLFFDAGRAWRHGENMDFFSNLATSIGLGARVATPLGPIRLDYGWGGEGGKLHFSFGQAF